MTFYDDAFTASPGLIHRAVRDRQHALRTETEELLRTQCEAYDARREQLWQWDYSSPEAFAASVEPNRRRWLEAVGDFGPPAAEMAPVIEPFCENEQFRAEWVTLQLDGMLRGRAVLALPKRASGPVPVVICQHGVSCSPE